MRSDAGSRSAQRVAAVPAQRISHRNRGKGPHAGRAHQLAGGTLRLHRRRRAPTTAKTAEKASAYGDFLDSLGLRGKDDSGRIPEFPGSQQNEARPSNLPYRASQEGFTLPRRFASWTSRATGRSVGMASLPRPHECYTPDRKFWDMYPDDLALPPTIHNSAAHRPPHFQADGGKVEEPGMVIRAENLRGRMPPRLARISGLHYAGRLRARRIAGLPGAHGQGRQHRSSSTAPITAPTRARLACRRRRRESVRKRCAAFRCSGMCRE